MPPWTPWLLLTLGASLLIAGAVVVLRARKAVAKDRWQAARDELEAERRIVPRDQGQNESWSFASHAALGLALMGAGYHLIAWALPSHTLLAVPPSLWYIVPIAAVIMVALSRSLDQMESRA